MGFISSGCCQCFGKHLPEPEHCDMHSVVPRGLARLPASCQFIPSLPHDPNVAVVSGLLFLDVLSGWPPGKRWGLAFRDMDRVRVSARCIFVFVFVFC